MENGERLVMWFGLGDKVLLTSILEYQFYSPRCYSVLVHFCTRTCTQVTIGKENKIYVYIIEYTIIGLIIIEGESMISTVKITLTALSSKRSIGNDIVF